MKNIQEAGFTLIEVLVAISVLSFMMLGVYSLTDSGTKVKDEVTEEDKEFLQVETALSVLDRDISSLYSPLFFTIEEKKGPRTSEVNESRESERFKRVTEDGRIIPIVDAPEKGTLIFLSMANKRRIENTKQSNFAWVKYSLRKSSSEDSRENADFELVRQYSPNDPYKKEFGWENVKQNLLLKNIKKFEFMFWNPEREKYVSGLDELPEKRFFRLIKIKLAWIDRDNYEHNVEQTFRPLWPKIPSEVLREFEAKNSTNPKSGDESEGEAND